MQYLKNEIRDRILDAAIDEFKEFGFADASIRNIANNAEISLGNIYRYFENKEALYLAVINPFMESIKQTIENNFVFIDKPMKEIASILLNFLMKYSDEIIIIRKGNTDHYDSFVSYIVGVTSAKIKEMITVAFPEIDQKIHNPDFYNAVAEGFLTSLFKVIRKEDNAQTQERNISELITFYFGHLVDRFYHFDV